MIVNSNLRRTLESIVGDPKLDKSVKEVFADKQVLARILKYTTTEFADADYDDIMAVIEGEPEVETILVEPGLTNATRIPDELSKLDGRNTESNIQNEGSYTFDVRFNVKLPDDKRAQFGIRIVIDVEAQYNYHTRYDLVTRGVFYSARMISAQSGTEFIADDYGNLRKVYSIWICMDPPDYAENSIVRFSLKPEVIVGVFPPEKLDIMKYDLMNVVLVFISTEHSNEKNELCGMLELLLNDRIEKEERMSELESRYGMKRTVELEGRVNGMCDYSVGIARKNYLKGVSEGEESGQNKLVEAINRLRSGESPEDIIKSGMDEHTVNLALTLK